MLMTIIIVISNILTVYHWPGTVIRTEVYLSPSILTMNRYYYLHFIDEGN